MARAYARTLLTPARESRRDRRRRRAAERARLETARTDLAAARRADAAGERTAGTVAYLPAGGESGPAALRSWRRLHIPPHRATSAVLAGAYPFLAEGGLGSEGVLIGADLFSGGSFCYDPWELYRRGLLTNPNALIAGVIGTGKSALAKSLVTRSIAFGRRVYVPGDPKGEWTGVTAIVGGRAIVLGQGLPARLNPLDAGHRPSGVDVQTWRSLIWQRRRDLVGTLAAAVLGRPLAAVEHTALDAALRAACTATPDPTLPLVVNRLLDPDHAGVDLSEFGVDSPAVLRADGRHVAHALRRMVHGDLAGLFDGQSTVAFDTTAPMVSVDLSRIAGNDDLISTVMTCASSWMEAALLDPAAGRRWLVYDEAWRIMRHPALIRRMQAQWKLSRAYGLANLMVVHRLSDLDAVGEAASEARALAHGLLADASTRVIYRQEADQLTGSGTALGLTATERGLLPGLGVGQGLWKIGRRTFVVQHQLTPGEFAAFDTTARMTDLPRRDPGRRK